MKIFKIGELIKASDINSNFSKCIKTDLSNCPVIPCNKGGTGRADCTIAYADKAGIAEIAEVARVAESISSVGSGGILGGHITNAVIRNNFSYYTPDYGNRWLAIGCTWYNDDYSDGGFNYIGFIWGIYNRSKYICSVNPNAGAAPVCIQIL